VKKAVQVLQEIAGPSSPVLFLKMGTKDWTPVGEENLYAVVKGNNSTEAVVICDSEGNSKAISGWASPASAEAYVKEFKSMGLLEFEGNVILPI
jgi:hypothetical protein